MEQKPIRTFNVCDEDGNIYEAKVFNKIVTPHTGGLPEPTPYNIEVMYINDDIIIEENDDGELETTINGVNTILHPC